MPNPAIALQPISNKRRARRGEGLRYIEEVALAHSGDECLPWPFGRTDGYASVWNSERQQNDLVHRIVCSRINGPPPSPDHEAAHTCGNGQKGCISPNHLVWKTRLENATDMITHGRSQRGAAAHFSKLTGAETREIRSLRGRLSQRAIAKLYGVSQAAVKSIQLRRSWAWIT